MERTWSMHEAAVNNLHFEHPCKYFERPCRPFDCCQLSQHDVLDEAHFNRQESLSTADFEEAPPGHYDFCWTFPWGTCCRELDDPVHFVAACGNA